jgi:hypothetical protein
LNMGCYTIMSNAFINQWRVNEYVFLPNGEFLGNVLQERNIQKLANGNLRVTQRCQTSIRHHPMSAFNGEWVFEMRVDGRNRYYLGADVVGSGWAWGDGIITGKGIWTRFGHNFTSYGVMVTPNRQITGGKFFNGGECIAMIMGVAEPAHLLTDEAYPHLDIPQGLYPNAQITPVICDGTITTFDGNGIAQDIGSLKRHFTAHGWHDDYITSPEKFVVQLTPHENHYRVSGTTEGILKNYGAWREMVCYQLNENILFEMVDLIDSHTQTLTQLVFGYRDNHLVHVEVTKLELNDDNQLLLKGDTA